ncbi:uncharacterized protein [Watersipora subatra]|uniref:uncharacterized protein n=1 Tax=Watersipora subatra TaxID=2589382 RepID=UPI00355BA06E
MKTLRILLTISSLTSLISGEEERWVCTGKLSRVTFDDCDKLGSQGQGCYYLRHFAQYRSCADICNDVIHYSLDQSRCDAYCPDYLRNNCKVLIPSQQTTMATHPPSTTASTPTTTSTDDSEVLLLALCLVAAALVAATVSIIVRFKGTITISRHQNQDIEQTIGKDENACIIQYSIEATNEEQLDNCLNETKVPLSIILPPPYST